MLLLIALHLQVALIIFSLNTTTLPTCHTEIILDPAMISYANLADPTLLLIIELGPAPWLLSEGHNYDKVIMSRNSAPRV